MRYERLEQPLGISKNTIVSVKYLGKTTEITFSSTFNNCRPHILKIDAKRYVDMDSGEIKTFKVREDEVKDTRLASPESLRKTLKKVRELVQTNVTDSQRVRWCTLTYRENMTDTKRLYEDLRKFFQRLQYYCKAKGYGKFEYIGVCEPQGRGSFHMHVFLIWEKRAPYIDNEAFREIWGHGFVKITALDDIDNIGGYFQSYLTDLEIPDEKIEYFNSEHVKTVTTGNKEKRFIKGARLHMYPKYFNILRHSRGIKKPEKEIMTYEEALKKVSGKKLCYKNAFALMTDDGFQLTVSKEEYR